MELDIATTPLGIYFAAVDAGDFEMAVETFSEDCVYARPPVPSGPERATSGLEIMRGREAVRAFLVARGWIPLQHTVRSAVIDEHHCFIEGSARYTDPAREEESVFIAHADLDSDGRITRFVALSATGTGDTLGQVIGATG